MHELNKKDEIQWQASFSYISNTQMRTHDTVCLYLSHLRTTNIRNSILQKEMFDSNSFNVLFFYSFLTIFGTFMIPEYQYSSENERI